MYFHLYTPPLAGTHFPSHIAQEIDKSFILVVLWGVSSGSSEWIEAEVEYAERTGSIIKPVLLDDVDPPKTLKYNQAVRAFDNPGWKIDILNDITTTIHDAWEAMMREKIFPGKVIYAEDDSEEGKKMRDEVTSMLRKVYGPLYRPR